MNRIKRGISGLLTLVMSGMLPALGTETENLEWHHVLPNTLVETIGEIHGRGVAVDYVGTVYVTTDGADWEAVATLGSPENVIFLNDGMVVITETTEDYINYHLNVYYSSDLQSFDLAYSVVGDVHWDNQFYTVGDGFVAIYRENDYDHWTAIHSADGIDWSPVLTGEYFIPFNVSRGEAGNLVLHSDLSQKPWYETADGGTWSIHNGLVGTIAPIGSRYVGIGIEDSPKYSENGINWASVDLVLPQGPRTLKRCGDRIVLFVRYQHVYVSTDGLNWETSAVPEPPYAHPYTSELAYHEGYIWARRKLVDPAPGRTIPEWVPRSESFRSMDGLTWEAADWPANLQDAGIAWESDIEPLPENLESLNVRSQVEPDHLSADGIVLEIKEAPDSNRMALYLGIDGAEPQTVDRTWGTRYNFDPPYVTPSQIIYLNGVFLCLNTRHELALLDPRTERLQQPDLQSDLPLSEDSIGISWDPVPEADRYRVYRYEEDSEPGSAIELGVAVEASHVDRSPELEKEIRYYYYVIAENDAGISSLASPAAISRLWSLRAELESSGGASFGGPINWWREVDWLGYVYVERFPWIWTTSHKWSYLREEAIGFWLWDTGLGWIWSQRELYPNIYDATGQRWLLYLEGSSGTRWFFDYTTGDWVSL